MKRHLCVLIFLCNIVISQNITLEDIWVIYKFYPRQIENIYSLKDGYHYTVLEGNDIIKYNYKTGKRVETIFQASSFEGIGKIDDYTFSEDESLILISTRKEQIYRHSAKYVYYIYNIKNKTLKKISEKQLQEASISADGKYVAYVYENNIYIYDITSGNEQQITTDGKKNYIINGIPDWVYEEEFSFSKAYQWSNDSKYIAYLKFDESEVKEYSIQYFKDLYPQEYKYKYPKAGEKNSTVTLHIYNLETKSTLNVKLESDTDYYIPRIYWTVIPDLLFVFKLNRLQNEFKIYSVNAKNGDYKVVYYEKSNTYIELPQIIFCKDGSFFITSDKDGFNHIYWYDINGNLLKQITRGNFDVTKINGFDYKNNVLYYTSTEFSPIQRNVFGINVTSDKKICLTPEKGYNEVSFNKTYTYYINEYSNVDTPSIFSLYSIDGKLIRVLEDNIELRNKIKDANLSKGEFFKLQINENLELNGYILKPLNFDIQKKYPVFFSIYGGPGHQEVMDKWDYMGLWHQFLASKGYIVVSIDNRGTGGRGAEFKKCTYGNLGKLESEDQIAAAKMLCKMFNFIDSTRIGIFGWSFGGYLSTLCLARSPETFKLAIAVAPVTNWRYYDSIYTERYNGLPQLNPKGYDENSPINHVKKIKGKYLLIHGTADDNVHFQNTVELVKKLVDHNKDFEVMFYPNSNHGIYTGKNTRYHLFNKISNFIFTNL